MGQYDSSATRVVPVFNKLLSYDPTGRTWLPRLIHLPEGGSEAEIPDGMDFGLRALGWGKQEAKLAPPIALLSWLARHPRKPISGILSKDPEKAVARQEWIDGSEARMVEALGLLMSNPSAQKWHLFEGATRPDVYLETKDLLVVIEGKRTEHGPTTSTKWMDGRHQMLRHLDCAWEIRGHKKVLGFFIVDSHSSSPNVPDNWCIFAKETVSPEAISSSLPHRGPEEQRQIADAFIGVTTWQRVCKEFSDEGLNYAELPDTFAIR